MATGGEILLLNAMVMQETASGGSAVAAEVRAGGIGVANGVTGAIRGTETACENVMTDGEVRTVIAGMMAIDQGGEPGTQAVYRVD